MSKPVNFPEEILDFAQSYLCSGITLANQYSKKASYETLLNNSRGYLLCSHFLTAHGIELYLKFLIKLLNGTPPSNTHSLGTLSKKASDMLVFVGYKSKLFNKKEIKLINYLDQYEKFRYPADQNWKVVPDIFNESKKWTVNKAKKLSKEFEAMKSKLNNWGYKITKKTK